MSSSIRHANSEDLEPIMALYRQLQSDDPVLPIEDIKSAFSQILERDGLSIFVLESDGEIVSSCYLNIIPNLTRSARPYALIENVVTLESMRGWGFGKQVIQHAIQAAWEAGCYKVMLMTGSKNPKTHAFYRACGFNGDEKQGYIIRAPGK